MTRKEAKRRAELYSALAEGKKIQFNQENGEWADLTMELIEVLSENAFRYRIKPEPKYRPFNSQEECWDEMHKHSDFGWVKFCNSICFIQNISFNKITVISDEEICPTSFEGGFTNMKFVDGTPFGIKEESDEQ